MCVCVCVWGGGGGGGGSQRIYTNFQLDSIHALKVGWWEICLKTALSSQKHHCNSDNFVVA